MSAVGQQVFTFKQVQQACKNLLEEEIDQIENDQLPKRTRLIADVFTRMTFDAHQYIDRELLSEEQAALIEQYAG